jgi:hypothetical protein
VWHEKVMQMSDEPFHKFHSGTENKQKQQLQPGLPDGLFSKPKIQIWVNFRGSCNGR